MSTNVPFQKSALVGWLLISVVGCQPQTAPLSEPQSASRSAGPSKTKAEPKNKAEPGANFFAPGIRKMSLEISDENIQTIEQDHRPYGRAKLTIDSRELATVGVKLKGAAGSYQRFDGKPGFTINLDKFRKKQDFDGIDKFHLNNAVQDESYLSEWLGSEVFREAGYPWPRVTHSLLQINDLPPRLYVVRESYTPAFVKRFFQASAGNLYDGGFLQDLDGELQKDAGDGPDDRRDLKGIVEALRSEDYEATCERIPKLIEMDRFLTFMALERMLCHWDGYSNNANNYRIYFDPTTNQAVFLPHGMDQLYGDPGMGLFDYTHPMLSSFVMTSHEWRKRYRDRVRRLMPLFHPDVLHAKIDRLSSHLIASVRELDADAANVLSDRIRELKERVSQRAENLATQLEQPEDMPQSIAVDELLRLEDWYPVTDGEHIQAERSESDPASLLTITMGADQPGFGSWQKGLLLARGKYRFQGRYKTSRLQPIEENLETIHLRAGKNEVWNLVLDETDWTSIEMDIIVREDQNWIDFVLGLRAKEGTVTIDPMSLQLLRLK